MSKKIYIKAYASVSSLGHTEQEITQSIQENKACIQSQFGKSVACLPQASEEGLRIFLEKHPHYLNLDRSIQLILWMGETLKKAIQIESDTGINVSSSRGASHYWEKQHLQFIEKQKLSVYTSPNTTLGNVSSYLGGHLNTSHINFSHSITCSSALHSICNAFAWLKSGLSDTFICGGTESCISPFTLEMFDKMGIYSHETLPYPSTPLYSKNTSNRMILGEGAGLFYLDTNAQGALAEIEGIGFASETLKHPADISEDGLAYQKSMTAACKDIPLQAVDYVLMHAPGTLKGDVSETQAIHTVFGKNQTNMFSTKYLYGHSLGASGALNIDFALRMFAHNIQPEFPYTTSCTNTPKEAKRILINASGFGGNAVSILLRKIV